MLSDFEGELVDILLGFHDIRYRYKQWDEVIKSDAAGRVAGLTQEIGWIESRKAKMLEFWAKFESGEIPKRFRIMTQRLITYCLTTKEVCCVLLT